MLRRDASEFLLIEAEAVISIVFDSLRLVDDDDASDGHWHVACEWTLNDC